MMKTVWLTDIHLDHLRDQQIREYFEKVTDRDHDAILMTGDISTGQELLRHLKIIEETIDTPVYFVLGNHDFYFSGIAAIRAAVTDFCKRSKNFVYLTSSLPVKLGNAVLCGVEGWYDGRASDPRESNIIMNDWLRIEEYTSRVSITPFDRQIDTILAVSQFHAEDDCKQMIQKLSSASKLSKNIIVATHVPMFVSDNPRGDAVDCWYTNTRMGSLLRSFAVNNPDYRINTFSGHTHRQTEQQIWSNLVCRVGGSVYSSPGIAGIIET